MKPVNGSCVRSFFNAAVILTFIILTALIIMEYTLIRNERSMVSRDHVWIFLFLRLCKHISKIK